LAQPRRGAAALAAGLDAVDAAIVAKVLAQLG
jgi:hypothetical protein